MLEYRALPNKHNAHEFYIDILKSVHQKYHAYSVTPIIDVLQLNQFSKQTNIPHDLYMTSIMLTKTTHKYKQTLSGYLIFKTHIHSIGRGDKLTDTTHAIPKKLSDEYKCLVAHFRYHNPEISYNCSFHHKMPGKTIH